MTDKMMELRGLLEERAGADLLIEISGSVAELLIELGACPARSHGGKSADRVVQRNDYHNQV